VTSNGLLNCAKHHAIVNVSNLAGQILASPLVTLSHGTRLSSVVCEAIGGIRMMIATGDATNAFKGIFGVLTQ
jgi:hypothetical protein